MNIIKQLWTLLTGFFSIFLSASHKVLKEYEKTTLHCEQQIREMKSEIQVARTAATEIIAHKEMIEDKLEESKVELEQWGSAVLAAEDKAEDIKQDCLEHFLRCKQEVESYQVQYDDAVAQSKAATELVKQLTSQASAMESQLLILQSWYRLAKSEAKLKNISSGDFESIRETMDNIRAASKQVQAETRAQEQLKPASKQDLLNQAHGRTSSSSYADVLASLKQKV